AVVGRVVSAEEMCSLYARMSRPKAAGRRYYNLIRSAPLHGQCPLCGHRQVATLDHYLPKSEFPAFAVLPLNLIPACRDCNSAKLARVVLSANEQTLHPYYDDVDGEQW